MTIDRVPKGSRIFLDSTIFIYHFTGTSAACRHLLERAESGDIKAVTSVVVVAEVAHRLMTIEAVTAGAVAGKDVVKKLRGRPEVVRALPIYSEQVERIPLMGVDVRPLDLGTLIQSADVRRQYGLLVNDSLVVAAAREARADGIASADADFRRVTGLKVYWPDDIG